MAHIFSEFALITD